MPYEIVMPRLGWNMEEGTLVEWLKRDGEPVIQGEMVCTIEGDKAAADVESFEGGILKIPDASPPPGRTVPVGTLLGYIVAEQEAEAFDPNAGGTDVVKDDGSGDSIETVPAGKTGPVKPCASSIVGAGAHEKAADPAVEPGIQHERDEPAISPRARRAAEAAGIDWRTLKGSGRSGRIVERDVHEAARQAGQAGQPGQPGQPRPHGSTLDGPDEQDAATRAADEQADATRAADEQADATRGGLRRVIARRMAEAHRTTAPVTLHTEADVTVLSSMFDGANRPSWYDLMAGITAVALAEHPVMNASWRDGVVLNDGIHIGIAVDTEGGVIAPVIRDVPGKSLREISDESKRLIQAALAGGLTLDQIEGGTFTLTNLGMYGVDAFTPIIHHPQCAILGLGRSSPRVVVLDEASGATGIRRMMALSLTFDHRIVDGAPAARFLQRVRQLAEEPDEWLDAG